MVFPTKTRNGSSPKSVLQLVGPVPCLFVSLIVSVFVWRVFYSEVVYDTAYLTQIQQNALNNNAANNLKDGNAQSFRSVKTVHSSYIPAYSEDYLIKNAKKLGYDPPNDAWAEACGVWTNKTVAPKIYGKLRAFLREVEVYNRLLEAVPVLADNRKRLAKDPNACDALRLHKDGLLDGVFKDSQQLSWTPIAGYVEPLFPPFRHPGSLCKTLPNKKHLLDTSYMIHDYEYMCKQLKPHSRTVFFDMGASLTYHTHEQDKIPPPVQVYNKYQKLGFHFDHIYAFELKPELASHVFEVLPPEYMKSFHWMNIGVNASKTSPANPFYNILLKEYTPDDFIVVKLDIDTSDVELKLVHQLIDDPRFHNLIDVFYFEHHVKVKEIYVNWKRTSRGSIKFSLELFHKLRQLGIPAHYWI